MIEFIVWQIKLWLVDYRRRVRDLLTHRAAGMTWDHNTPFARFLDWISPFDPFCGYHRRRLRRWLYIARYPITQLRLWSLTMSLAILDRIAPYTGPGKYEVLDPSDRLKAEWLDHHSEYADQTCGDLTIYPILTELFAAIDVPWSLRPEHWILERDEMGFVVILDYPTMEAAEIDFGGAEHRFDKWAEADQAGDRSEDEEYLAMREFENREGQPEFNGAFG